VCQSLLILNESDLSVKEFVRTHFWAQRIQVAQWELVNKLHWGTVRILPFLEWNYFLALLLNIFFVYLTGS
jgi:hypothetical protein